MFPKLALPHQAISPGARQRNAPQEDTGRFCAPLESCQAPSSCLPCPSTHHGKQGCTLGDFRTMVVGYGAVSARSIIKGWRSSAPAANFSDPRCWCLVTRSFWTSAIFTIRTWRNVPRIYSEHRKCTNGILDILLLLRLIEQYVNQW